MKRFCLASGCANEPVYRGHCQRHARAKEQRTNRQGKAVYSTKRWKLLRRRKLYENPICEYVDPDEGPCQELATDVHHRHSIAEGGAKWDLRNLESLCQNHHSQHTRAEQLLGSRGGF
jgi:5-methylcytosine-specific restriction endonuclease McrA